MTVRNNFFLWSLVLLLLVVVITAAGVGAVVIDPFSIVSMLMGHSSQDSHSDAFIMQYTILTSVRLPRVFAAAVIGASVAMAGAGLQGLFRNPLADPGLIGIASGASFSAALYIVVGAGLGYLGFAGLSMFTFAGAGLTAFIVYSLSRTGNGISVTTMLLAGVAMNAIAGAGTGLLTYLSDESQLRDLTFWLLGSLGGASWDKLCVLLLFTILPAMLLFRLAHPLNAFALGEEEATYLGLNAGRLKFRVIVLTTLMVGASVAFSGIIGFVGLVVPHLVRMVTGNDYRMVLRASALAGAVVLVSADLISRSVIAPAELPVGIVTAAIGAPVFLSILLREKRKLSFLWM